MRPAWLAVVLTVLVAQGGCQPVAPDQDPLAVRLIGDEKDPNHLAHIPMFDLPDKQLIVALPRMQSLGLLGPVLSTREQERPWASSFFPAWYGGAAGRWQDSKLVLVARSLFGMPEIDPAEAEALLARAAEGDTAANHELYRLAPTEKYDLAAGDYEFHATNLEARIRGHNTEQMLWRTPFWTGYCNGMAVAATRYPEPIREVDVLNPEGRRVRFHPQDIKALMGLAMASAELLHWGLGKRCDRWTASGPECLDVNPAALVVAIVNRLGLARSPLVIDQNPLEPVVNVAVRSGQVRLLDRPTPVSGLPGVAYLVNAQLDLSAASTLLGYAAADVRAAGNGFFRPVEGGEVKLVYQATLALDASQNLVGGRWIGTKMSGPDFAWGLLVDPASQIQQLDHLVTNRYMRWSLVSALQQASISRAPEIPVLRYDEIVKATDNQVIASFYKDVKYKLHHGRPVRIFGFLDARRAAAYDHVSFFAGTSEQPRPDDSFVATYGFPKNRKNLRRLIFDVQGDVATEGASYLHGYYYAVEKGELVRKSESLTKIFER